MDEYTQLTRKVDTLIESVALLERQGARRSERFTTLGIRMDQIEVLIDRHPAA